MSESHTVGNKTYLTIRELAEDYNIAYATLQMRLKKGMPMEEALKPPTTSIVLHQ